MCVCVCVCVCVCGGEEALRQCEVEVMPRQNDCGVLTCALAHASCSFLAPEDLLTVMSFDSCHLWVSSRSSDMDRTFYYFLYLFFRGGCFTAAWNALRVTTVPTREEEWRDETLRRLFRQSQDTRRQKQSSFAVVTHRQSNWETIYSGFFFMFTIKVLQTQSATFNALLS